MVGARPYFNIQLNNLPSFEGLFSSMKSNRLLGVETFELNSWCHTLIHPHVAGPSSYYHQLSFGRIALEHNMSYNVLMIFIHFQNVGNTCIPSLWVLSMNNLVCIYRVSLVELNIKFRSIPAGTGAKRIILDNCLNCKRCRSPINVPWIYWVRSRGISFSRRTPPIIKSISNLKSLEATYPYPHLSLFWDT